MLKNILIKTFFIFILACLISINSCSFKPEPQPLPLSVSSTLNLLQENPQFVMYLNFKNMRRTEFWKKNVSDSILNAEKTFGSLLNTFKMATGASISEGLDELYYSNSWFGENAIVMKGVLDNNKLIEYISGDTLFSVAKIINGQNIYLKNDNGLYFYFKDNNTICASNYLKQIGVMFATQDTSKSGILVNEKIYKSISDIIYKEDMWMISTERFFIKGIFQNFVLSTSGLNLEESDSTKAGENEVYNDSSDASEKLSIANLYKRFNSVSFSSEMGNDLKFLVQCDLINEESSKYLRSILSGFLTVTKLRSTGSKDLNSIKILEKIKLDRYDNSVFIELNVDEKNINELRKINLLSEPGSF